MIRLEPVVFSRHIRSTDLTQMVDDDAYRDALFLFNDNFEDRNVPVRGANTADVRPRAFREKTGTSCVVVGIPTGWAAGDGGFQKLSDIERRVIKLAFERVNTALHINSHLRRVVYSCDPKNHDSLGFATFAPNRRVVAYINGLLNNIPRRFCLGWPLSLIALDMGEEVVAAQVARHAPCMQKLKYASYHSNARMRHERVIR